MDKIPKSIRSIFVSKDSDVDDKQPSVPSSPSSPSNSTSISKSIGEFIKSHKRISSFSSQSDQSKNERRQTPIDKSASRSPPKINTNSQTPVNLQESFLANGCGKNIVSNDLGKSDSNHSPTTETLESSQSEVNDADLDSDDHEDSEDNLPLKNFVPQEDTENEINQLHPHLLRRHSHMSHAYAESIIGGVSVPSSNTNLSQPSDRSSKETEEGEHKTFSFSLPFGNPLANIEFPSLKLPSFISSLTNEGNDTRQEYLNVQKQVSDKLNRQVSILSWQEDLVYNNVKEQDNSRFRAVRLALTPSILQNKTEPVLNDFKGEVVIMGGYRGSILRDRATGRRVWIPIKAGFNLRKIDLTVGINDEDEYNMESKIYPDGMLTHVGPVDISRKLIKRLKENPNCKVYEFSYDWRLSSDINSAKLVKFLQNLPSNKDSSINNSKRKGPIVIAHSMGGLIAHHAMQQEPELFRGLIYAGVPSACPNMLGPFRYGDSILMSSKILTAQVNFLMRSSFVFLPLDGRCFMNSQNHNIKYDLDFFDVNTWIDYELSPLVAKPKKRNGIANNHKRGTSISETKQTDTFTYPDSYQISFEEAVSYLDRTLKRTKKFLLELEYDPDKANRYPQLACLYSHSIPTLKGAEVPSREAIKTDTYEHFVFGPGDGVVYYNSLMPEGKPGFEVVAKVAADRGHVSLLNDLDAVFKTITAILTNEKKTESVQ